VQRLALLITIIGAALLAVILVFGLRQARFRLRRLLEERIESRLSERTKIAGDLHDSLLQGFQALMFRLQAVRQLLPERACEAVAQLERALESGDRTIEEGRDAARDLRELNAVPGDLTEVLAAFREQFSGSSGSDPPSYRVLTEGAPKPLDAPVYDEVYLVAREAIRSAFQHADATRIEADLVYGPTYFCIRVRHDGADLGPHALVRDRGDGHLGLPGMRDRAVALEGEFNVWSHADAGTEVELRIPGHVAYAQPIRWWRLPRRESRAMVAADSHPEPRDPP
jgi:signal transduction histidine kinase